MAKKPLPQFIEPMMASVVKDPFDNTDWIFETKLDGFRAIPVIDSASKARIWSRNRLPLPMVLDVVNQLKLRSTILDGEIVALDSDGIPRFQLLQQWQKRPAAPVVYYLFDLLWSNGREQVYKFRYRLLEGDAPKNASPEERQTGFSCRQFRVGRLDCEILHEDSKIQ
jgi:ATP-dependent DNA ligase